MEYLRQASFIYRVTRATLIESILHAAESTLIAFSRATIINELPLFLNSVSVIIPVSALVLTDFDWWSLYCLFQAALLVSIFIRARAVVFVSFIFYVFQTRVAYVIIPCLNAILLFSDEFGRNAKTNVLVVSILLVICSRVWVLGEYLLLTLACEAIITYNYMSIGWKHERYMMESNAPFAANLFAFILGVRANGVDRWVDMIKHHPNQTDLTLLRGVWWKKNGEGFTLMESTRKSAETYTVPLSTSGTRAFQPNIRGVLYCFLNSMHPSILLTFRMDDQGVHLEGAKLLTVPLPIHWFSRSPLASFADATRDLPEKHSYIFVSSNILRRRVMRCAFL